MKSKQLGGADEQTHVLVFESGDDVLAGIAEFARQAHVTAAHFSAIGGFSDAVLGYFDVVTRRYRRIPVPEQVEVVSLSGSIALRADEPMVHAHVVVGRSDGSTHAGGTSAGGSRPADSRVDFGSISALLAPSHRRRDWSTVARLGDVRR
jgi:predicted DNA-binding protein with PD1-like motif